MQCPDCGAFITKEDLFCGECGRPLAEANPVQAPSFAPPAQGAPTIAAGPPVARPQPAPAAPSRPRSNLPIVAGAILAAGLALCMAGVAVFVLVSGGGNGQETPSPPPAQPGQVVLADDFSDSDNGWDVYSTDDTWAGYVDGEYRLGVYGVDLVTWGNPLIDLDLANFEIEVDARQVEGPLDNNLGVLVRYQPGDENFYWFQISSDGYYSVDLLLGDEWLSLVEWEESTAINQGLGVTNRIKVVCFDDQFSFYVNGTYLAGVSDATFRSGSVGLAAGTFDEAGVIVHFDDVTVRLLEDE